MKSRQLFVVALTIAALAVAAPGFASHQSSARTVAQTSTSHRYSTKYLLNHLTVKARPITTYARSKFKLWTMHSDGCNTRYEVLIRDAVRKPHVGAGCYLTAGKWVSPYDGFTTTNPTKIQIDHVVPLADAWYEGAYRWNAATREHFANDLGTRYDLLAVSGHSNESKGDEGPDEWLPPRKSFDCRYMADYTAVLWRWRLTIDSTQKAFLHSHLAACGWPTVKEPPRPAIHLRSSSSTGGGGGTATHACTRTSTGNCIKAGEFCPQADYGHYGYDANGDRLECTGDSSHPHWETA